MPQNFLSADREQAFLLPPSVRDWLPVDHLAWFVIDAVGVLDLAVFFAAYRADGQGETTRAPTATRSTYREPVPSTRGTAGA
jgi:hypothetical protein